MKPKLFSIFAVFAFLAMLTACAEKDFSTAEDSLVDLKTGNAVVMKVIAKGATLHGTNGIRFGPDGHLYIASVVGSEIIVMNKLNGKIINRFGPEVGVGFPDDLAFGPDGSIYWTELLIGFVCPSPKIALQVESSI